MTMTERRYTPENIQELGPGEIFVFGSNLSGMHGGGAARVAYEKFGAVWGQGTGLTRIGCGIAGFRDEEIAPLFKDTAGMANVILPRTFADILSR